MKKNLFFYAMAFCVAICNVACGNDDDNSNGNNGNTNPGKVIPAPAKADDAVAYAIPSGSVTAKSKDLVTPDGVRVTADLTGVDITESGKAIIEVTTTDETSKKKLNYVTFDAELDGDVYTIKDNGKAIGTRTRVRGTAKTRGNNKEDLYISLKFTLNSITGMLEFVTDGPVTATATEEALGKSINLISLARTWEIERMKLTLIFDDKSKSDASTTVYGGNLSSFITLADDNNVSLSDKDRSDLSKSILFVTLDKNGKFILTYADGKTDVADWNWVAGSNEAKLQIKLKDKDMGNKFLADNSQIEVQYYPETQKIILIMSTRLEDDKCDASLLINLK